MTDVGKIKNVSSDDLVVPWLGDRLVIAGAVVPVPLEHVTAYTQQEHTWEPADQAAQDAHDEMLEAIAAMLEVAGEPVDEQVAHSATDLVKVVIPAIAETAALLDLQAAELDRAPQRKTVLAAIDDRLAELAGPGVSVGHDVNDDPPAIPLDSGAAPVADDTTVAGTNDTPTEG